MFGTLQWHLFLKYSFSLQLLRLAPNWRGNQYHLFTKNCNHFAHEFALKLCGHGLPTWINHGANSMASMPFINRIIPRKFLCPQEAFVGVKSKQPVSHLSNGKQHSSKSKHQLVKSQKTGKSHSTVKSYQTAKSQSAKSQQSVKSQETLKSHGVVKSNDELTKSNLEVVSLGSKDSLGSHGSDMTDEERSRIKDSVKEYLEKAQPEVFVDAHSSEETQRKGKCP